MRNLVVSSQPFSQQILADTLNYDPETRRITLKAFKGGRVLLLDQQNGMQISAPAITMKRNPDGNPEIRGLGNVRMQLSQQEKRRILVTQVEGKQ